MILAFAPSLELDRAGLEIRLDGESVPVEPQVYDVVAYLVDHRDRVVPKEELLDEIWGDRFVSESALTSRIKSARRAVGDNGRSQSVIKTVHGRGYRWVAAPLESPIDQPAAPVAAPSNPNQPGPGAPVRPGELVISIESERHAGDDWPLIGRADELEALAAAYKDPDCGGVLLTGPAGLGKTRLARTVVTMATTNRIPAVSASGHAELQTVPLGCLSPLLPAEVMAANPGLDGELSTTVLVHRAAAALAERGSDEGASGEPRTIVFIDDAHYTDPLTQAVLVSAVMGQRIFLIATQRTTEGEELAFGGLVRNGRLRRLDLERVPNDALGVAVYSALGRPIEAQTMDRLLIASDGNPGTCRQLVEQSITEGALKVESGVWRLTGDFTPSHDLIALVEARLADVPDGERRAAETLAVAGEVHLDILAELVDEEDLDGLDLRGLLTVGSSRDGATIRLTHPIYGEVIRARLPALRARRLKSQLADAITRAPVDSTQYRLRISQWRMESGGEIVADDLLQAARLAVLQKDYDTARELTDRLLAESPSGLAMQLDAELLLRQGRFDEVESRLAAIDLDAVDDDTRAQIVRLRASNMMWNPTDRQAPIRLIEQHLDQVSGQARLSLESSWITYSAMVGDLNEVLERAERALGEAEGPIHLELARAVALCRSFSGRSTAALEMVAKARADAELIPGSAWRGGTGLLEFAEMKSLLDLGRADEAEVIARRADQTAPDFGWVNYALAWLDLYRDRPNDAIARLEPRLEVAAARGYDHTIAQMRSVLAMAHLDIGQPDRALEYALAAAPFAGNRQEVVEIEMFRGVGIVLATTGHEPGAREQLLDGGEMAARLGAIPLAVNILDDVAHLGRPVEAAKIVDQIDPEAMPALSRVWVEEIRALARDDHQALDDLADQLEAMGARYHARRTREKAAELAGS